jgi:hypothetical protein
MQMQNAKIIGLGRELFMKTPNCIETGLNGCFPHAQGI